MPSPSWPKFQRIVAECIILQTCAGSSTRSLTTLRRGTTSTKILFVVRDMICLIYIVTFALSAMTGFISATDSDPSLECNSQDSTQDDPRNLPQKKKRPGKIAQTDLRLRATTVEQLQDMPLSEFVELLPNHPGKVVGKLYDDLFCNHPDVVEIVEGREGTEAIAQTWSDLRVKQMNSGMRGKYLRRLSASTILIICTKMIKYCWKGSTLIGLMYIHGSNLEGS